MPKTGENEDPGKTALRALGCVEELFTLFLAACLSARLRASCCVVLVIPALFSPKSIALCSSVLFVFRIRRRCIQLSEEIPWCGEET
jgi:hypothetical protein